MSENFEALCPDVKMLRGKVRFFHADGSHKYDNVWNDIKLADALMGEEGILVLDDFQNPHYPQVQAATYSYISSYPDSFKVILIGGNKAVLCRSSMFEHLFNHIIEFFQHFMEQEGSRVQLSKTDRHDHFDAIAFLLRPPGDDTLIYGANLYGAHLAPRTRKA